MRAWIWIVGLAIGCGPSTDELVSELSEWGAYNVGYTETQVNYAPRDGSGERTLRLATWYPTNDVTGVEPRYRDLFDAPDVWASAAPAEGPFPLVVYSHGHQGYAEASSFLMSYLASHGFVVAAPDHTGNTTFDGSSRDTAIYYLRMMDISAVIDDVQDNGPTEVTEHITAFGHSFGGYTIHGLAGATFDVETLSSDCASGDGGGICSDWDEDAAGIFEAGLMDKRIQGFVSMAAGDFGRFGTEGFEAIPGPLLMMDGELDPATGGSADSIWGGLQGRNNTRVHILGGGHQTFSDMSGILEQFDGLIPAEEGNHILRIYSMAYMRQLMGESGYEEILDGTYQVSGAVKLSQ